LKFIGVQPLTRVLSRPSSDLSPRMLGDVFGATKAGWHAAFIARNGITLFPLGPKPGIVGPDMKAVTDALLSNQPSSLTALRRAA
jgi:hypothetical protein